jgi:excisionase family DNA binding protein
MVVDQDRLLVRVPEAAERLGLSRSSLYELIAAGELRVVRYGRAVRVPVSELANWVERQVEPGKAPAVAQPSR